MNYGEKRERKSGQKNRAKTPKEYSVYYSESIQIIC